MSENASNPATVAVLLNQFQERTKTTDEQLASALGYESGRVIAMVKDGRMRLPINKVQELAAAMGTEPRQILRSVLAESAPEVLSVLEAVLPELNWTSSEVRLVDTLRKLQGDRQGVPIVFDGGAVIALMAVDNGLGFPAGTKA